jgi:signal transduction histidine kinase
MKPNAYLLLVDDDPVLLRSMARALGAAGYCVEVAFSAAEGMRLARFRRPDLILLDVVLSDGSGIEVCRSLKEGPETSAACVVLISGLQTSSGHQELGLAAGADAYIVRPISTPDLVARIGALLRVQQAQSALRETHASLGRAATGSTTQPPQETATSTDRPPADAGVLATAKIETPADLAAKLARCLDELLTIIECNAAQVLEDPRLAPELRPQLTNVSVAANRGSNLTLALLHYSGQQISQPRVLDLNENLERLGTKLRSTLGESVTLEFQLASGLPPLFADPGMVEQCLLILAANARDAMPHGGRLILQTQPIDISTSDAARIRGASAGPHICLSATDTGCGMTPDIRQRMFEPFFTTKAAGRGFGLSLAVVEDVLRQHHGWIDVQSEAGRGTTFRLQFPITLDLPAASPRSG